MSTIPGKPSMRGFTLLEMLVALAILAFGLSAAIRASAGSADTLDALRSRQLAGWVAENRLAWLHAGRKWPEIGESLGQERQYGRDFIWRIEIKPTPQALFRRAEVTVSAAGSAPDQPPLVRLNAFLKAP